MKYVTILFSTPLVIANLEGRKNQTRRIIKPQPDEDGLAFNKIDNQWHDTSGQIYKPKAMPGDIFWVRETWGIGTRPHPTFGWYDGFEYRADEHFLQDNIEDLPIYPNEDVDFSKYDNGKEGWRPSIFMPKEACRLFLKVTKVRVERLKDISMEDAIAEGITPITAHNEPNRILGWHDYTVDPKDGFNTFFDPRESFFSLWESINGKESLNENPWLFVYDYQKIEQPENWPNV